MCHVFLTNGPRTLLSLQLYETYTSSAINGLREKGHKLNSLPRYQLSVCAVSAQKQNNKKFKLLYASFR